MAATVSVTSLPSTSTVSQPGTAAQQTSGKLVEIAPERSEQLLRLITELTEIDQELRDRKTRRLRAIGEAMKLTRQVTDVTCPEYYGRADLRIVEKMDMASVTSGELYSLLEWSNTFPFFRKLPISCRTAMLRKFAVYQTVIEQGQCTAMSGLNNMWLLPNGTCMPRDLNQLPMTSQIMITEDRAWRQNKLYKQMTERCIDDVATPMRRLKLLPEELVTLKIIMLCQCGMQSNERTTESLVALKNFKDEIIKALFAFYRASRLADHEERFGNILLLISGIVSAAASTHESYRIQSIFGFVPFDKMTNSLLFQNEEPINLEI